MPAMNIKRSMPMSAASYDMPERSKMMAQPKMAMTMKKSAGLGIGDMMSSLGSSITSSVSGLFGATSSKKKSIPTEQHNINNNRARRA
jgi:hypothetical protein